MDTTIHTTVAPSCHIAPCCGPVCDHTDHTHGYDVDYYIEGAWVGCATVTRYMGEWRIQTDDLVGPLSYAGAESLARTAIAAK